MKKETTRGGGETHGTRKMYTMDGSTLSMLETLSSLSRWAD